MATIDWGNVPSWIASIGTVTTLSVSLYLVSRQGKALGLQIEEGKQKAVDRVEGQARHIHVKAANLRDHNDALRKTSGIDDLQDVGSLACIKVTNDSDGPIKDLEVCYVAAVPFYAYLEHGELVAGMRIEFVPAHSHALFICPGHFSTPISVQFTDENGRRWLRGLDGYLNQLNR